MKKANNCKILNLFKKIINKLWREGFRPLIKKKR